MRALSLQLGSPVSRIVANALLFQVGWFACVLGGDVIAVAATIAILALHGLWLCNGFREGALIVAIAIAGIGLDSALTQFGIFQFPDTSLGLIPLWLGCLWLLFATTLCHSLRWLDRHPAGAAGFGAIGGPGSYFAGSQLAGVVLAEPIATTLLLLAVCWALLLPLLFFMARRLSC